MEVITGTKAKQVLRSVHSVAIVPARETLWQDNGSVHTAEDTNDHRHCAIILLITSINRTSRSCLIFLGVGLLVCSPRLCRIFSSVFNSKSRTRFHSFCLNFSFLLSINCQLESKREVNSCWRIFCVCGTQQISASAVVLQFEAKSRRNCGRTRRTSGKTRRIESRRAGSL